MKEVSYHNLNNAESWFLVDTKDYSKDKKKKKKKARRSKRAFFNCQVSEVLK